MDPTTIISLLLKAFGTMRAGGATPPMGFPPPQSNESPGDRGYSVEWVQESLNKLDGAKLDVDGEYGPLTMKAVEQFQRKHGLKADGWVGVQTMAKIYSLLYPSTGR